MQKHALSKPKKYDAVFSPLPSDANSILYFDHAPVVLPFAEDFSTLHYHDRYEIGICEEGEGLFFCEGEFSGVSKGDLIFVAPECRHYSRSIHRDRFCYCRFLYLRAEAVEAYLPNLKNAKKTERLVSTVHIPVIIRPKDFPSAAAILTEAMTLCSESVSYREEMLLLRTASFLLESTRWFPRIEALANETSAIGKSLQAADVARYLTLHYSEAQTADELAKICHLSPSQLRRQFLKAYQMPPIAYRNYLRCRIAAELLSRTALSVNEISAQIGYSTPSDFYRRFQKQYKMSPTEYRKNVHS